MAGLAVDLYGTRIGHLRGPWRTFDFDPDPAGVARFGLDSPALSLAVPLTLRARRSGRERRQAWFAGLLPEGPMLQRLAAEAGVPAHDTVAMLRRYGRDIAGALQIWDPDVPGEPRTPRLLALTGGGVADLLRQVRDSPLANVDAAGKTSLGGVQEKIVLARVDGRWHRALDGYPSTHILKSRSATIGDEEYGARIARHLGLARHETWIEAFDDVDALVIERFDRDPERIHQEDLSQVLGLVGDQKYQRIGGRASLARVAAAIRDLSGEPWLWLLRLVTLATAVGNLDLHTKNLAVLHPLDSDPVPAPAYDVVPMAHRPSDGELALAVAGEYRQAAVTVQHLVDEAASWGLGTGEARAVVGETCERVRDFVRASEPHPLAQPGLRAAVLGFCEHLLAGRPAGGS